MRVSVVTPVHDETETVRELCEGLRATLGPELFEIFIVISQRSSQASSDACMTLARRFPDVVKVVLQKGPRGIGSPYREGISYARGTHVLCMDSDGEMELSTVSRLCDLFRADPKLEVAIASRWLPGGGFVGYDPVKLRLNWIYQKLVRTIFGTDIHDLTYGFKMFRTETAQRLPFTGVRHEFACEGTLLPIRLGLRIAETPTQWTRRRAGRSSSPFIDNFRYVGMALRLRFAAAELLDTPRRAEARLIDGRPAFRALG